MKTRLSHRWRITLAASVVAGLLFTVVLLGVYAAMARMSRRAAGDLLDAPMNEVITSLKSGDPLDEEVGAQEHVTVVVFSSDGRQRFRSGTSRVLPWHGSGEIHFGGRDLIYRSQPYGPETIVAVSDWTETRRSLAEMRTLFLLLILPLAASVGLAAFIAAGLMYRPLRQLTSEAQGMATSGNVGQLADPHDPDFSALVLELNMMLQRIAAEVERQDRLVTDVAHDLRTPLTVIRGRLETALMRGRPEDYVSAMETAVRETERLSIIAESILEGQAQRSTAEPIELSHYLSQALDRWKAIFDQRGARLIGSFVECRSTITPEEWASLLDNLLDNAFKYGGDSISVSLEDGLRIVLEISDNGGGIPEADRDRIFDRFVRLDSSRSAPGHGLGLYLCASMVRGRSGAIFVKSPKSPTTLRVELPGAEASARGDRA